MCGLNVNKVGLIWNSRLFSTSWRRAKHWSGQERPFRNPAWFSLRHSWTASLIRHRTRAQKTFPAILSRVMPRLLAQITISPFFGILTITPLFQSEIYIPNNHSINLSPIFRHRTCCQHFACDLVISCSLIVFKVPNCSLELVPLRGKKHFKPRTQKRILASLRSCIQKFRRAPPPRHFFVFVFL